MVWPEYLHHLSVHFPIVLAMVLAAIGLYSLKRDTPELRTLIRWTGWTTLALTTVALVSGIIAAPGWFGGDGSPELTHHRDLAITAWCTIALATYAYDHGHRHDIRDLRTFAITIWLVATFAVIGTGHWGGSTLHPESVPWAAQEP
ncbi:MAG: hypothetical protein H0U74_20025 [Bradymonadaceae bacterium]|nr:hypothetical protein [Lujinxingiaceae bacterium]